MKYEMVLWDLDGTLLDTSEGVIRSIRYCLSAFDMEIPCADILKTFIGPPIQKSFEENFKVSAKTAEEMATVFRNRYKTKDLLYAEPYKDIERVLKTLYEANITQAIATYKREDYAKKLIEYFDFFKYMRVICGSDLEGLLQKKDIMKNCLDYAGISNFSKVLMIGDSQSDALGAELIGVDFLGVSYGFGFKKNKMDIFANSIGCADSPDEILSILRRS